MSEPPHPFPFTRSWQLLFLFTIAAFGFGMAVFYHRQSALWKRMNSIEAKLVKTPYVENDHLMIWVDGEPFRQFFENQSTGHSILGLVPTWLNWMIDEREQEIVHARMIPTIGSSRVPILMCPDDLDFSCSLVVADVLATEHEVHWNRIGYEKGQSIDPNDVGNDVRWIEEFTPLHFRRSDYETCVRAFLRQNQET